MSVNRCMHLFRLRRRMSALTLSSTGALPDSRVCYGSTLRSNQHSPNSLSCIRGISSNSSSSTTPDTSLFVPLAFKADGSVEGSVGAELTQPLDKSELHLIWIVDPCYCLLPLLRKANSCSCIVLQSYIMWISAGELLKVLNRFYKRKEMQKLAADQGLDGKIWIINIFL